MKITRRNRRHTKKCTERHRTELLDNALSVSVEILYFNSIPYVSIPISSLSLEMSHEEAVRLHERLGEVIASRHFQSKGLSAL